MQKTWENGKKPSFGTDFGHIGPNLGPKIFFRGFYLCFTLDIIASYHCMQFQGKVMNLTWENCKKPSFGTDFGPFVPNLGPKNFFHGFHPYYMLNIVARTKFEKIAKNRVLGPILAYLAQIWATKFFFKKNLAPSVTRYQGQLSSCTISEKTNDLILGKLSGGWTDGQTDGWEWFHRTLSD